MHIFYGWRKNSVMIFVTWKTGFYILTWIIMFKALQLNTIITDFFYWSIFSSNSLLCMSVHMSFYMSLIQQTK